MQRMCLWICLAGVLEPGTSEEVASGDHGLSREVDAVQGETVVADVDPSVSIRAGLGLLPDDGGNQPTRTQ
jgi:hypothetical protein